MASKHHITLDDGMEHICDSRGDLRMLDSEYWGRSLKAYRKRMDYSQQIYEVVSMSSEIAKQCMGDAYMTACPIGATTYKGMAIPEAIRVDCTPDLVRCLPPRGEIFAKAYAKSIWLLERTSVALDGPLDEFLGDIKHSEETGKSLKGAVD